MLGYTGWLNIDRWTSPSFNPAGSKCHIYTVSVVGILETMPTVNTSLTDYSAIRDNSFPEKPTFNWKWKLMSGLCCSGSVLLRHLHHIWSTEHTLTLKIFKFRFFNKGNAAVFHRLRHCSTNIITWKAWSNLTLCTIFRLITETSFPGCFLLQSSWCLTDTHTAFGNVCLLLYNLQQAH